ncbi:GLPGLI family protein [Rasiella rasia]|uniref:GLPGLI family protein n=1 Tax=Rasiella rasia TaxID=2744027 RepID=A0A6G6GP36_9FLAO|nr:GLPGLI family protein [Rasiella rasia]QIE60244.1 GLPGLI family protein [Rasiella rasia]
MKTILISLSIMIGLYATSMAQQFEGIATYKTDRQVDLEMENDGMTDAMQEQIAAQLRKQFQKEYTLTFNKNESIYEEMESLDSPAPMATGGISIVISGGTDVLYRNIPENQYTVQTEISGKEFLIKDALETPEWTFEKETRNIGNYTCFKATREREVTEKTMTNESDSLVEVTRLITTTAWYTLDIPVKHGPSDFWGLPGLILQLEEGDLTILCSKIVLNPEKEIKIEAPRKGKEVTQAEFDEIQEKKSKEMMERFQSDGRKKGEKSSFSIKIGG